MMMPMNKVLAPPPVAARTSFLASLDKVMVFIDASFILKDGKSSYSFFMMKYNNPLVGALIELNDLFL